MQIFSIINALEIWAPPYYQESYDNSGLIVGNANWQCTGVLCTLDATEAAIDDAILKGCNLVVAHHPIVFSGIKKITPHSYIGRSIIKAIKNDICIYAFHTNLDNIKTGVNAAIATRIGLEESSLKILVPKEGIIAKLYTYVPKKYAETIAEALFLAGAGTIGQYDECSFSTQGKGSFRPLADSRPTIGMAGGKREQVEEIKLEMVFPIWMKPKILLALHKAHPYETPAYEIIPLANPHQEVGAGMIGRFSEGLSEANFLAQIKSVFHLQVIKHTALQNKRIQTVAFCGGAGIFLLKNAIAAGADAFITADIKYHEFFDADNQLLMADIGHWESEQFTIDLLANFLQDKFPTFAVLKMGLNTNPVNYFL